MLKTCNFRTERDDIQPPRVHWGRGG